MSMITWNVCYTAMHMLSHDPIVCRSASCASLGWTFHNHRIAGSVPLREATRVVEADCLWC
eukprot:56450-Eustigmatos_ZCMA.PRE.1